MESHRDNIPAISRVEFFDSYWAGLRKNGWQAVILHSWNELPETIPSDVDYAVADVTPKQLLRFLSEFCRKNGWRLAQVIEHEPDAFFCTCVQRGGDFEILALDVTWDYRRLGHHLISSALLQRDSRSIVGKSFQVPSPGAEAAYILAKAAAKGKEFGEVKHRLIELGQENLSDFSEKLSEVFPELGITKSSALEVVEEVAEWFKEASSFRGVRRGHRYGLRETKLYLRRILQPTGIWLASQEADDQQTFVETVVRPLSSLYRRTHQLERVALTRLPGIIAKLIRTSLVIERNATSNSNINQWKIGISSGGKRSPAEETCRILDLLEARSNLRISRLPP